MIEALIFDVDGTLAETEEYHRRAFNEAFAELKIGWDWDVALYRKLLRITGGKERILAFAAQIAPERLEYFRKITPEIHALKTRIYTSAVRQGHVPLRPGIAQLIADARAARIQLAIATTTTLENVSALLEAHLGPCWADIFPVVCAGDMVALKKPAPDIYQLALHHLSVPKPYCLAIEDSRNGVQSALAAGLHVVALKSCYAIEDDVTGARAIFANSDELTLAAISGLVV